MPSANSKKPTAPNDLQRLFMEPKDAIRTRCTGIYMTDDRTMKQVRLSPITTPVKGKEVKENICYSAPMYRHCHRRGTQVHGAHQAASNITALNLPSRSRYSPTPKGWRVEQAQVQGANSDWPTVADCPRPAGLGTHESRPHDYRVTTQYTTSLHPALRQTTPRSITPPLSKLVP